MRPANDRKGFTLIEIAIVVMVVGILAGITIPNMRNALLKADAVHIVSDAHTISLAAYDYLSDNGRFPSSSGYGTVPAQLVDHLPEGYQFNYRDDVLYAWFSFTLPSPDNVWGSRNIGILVINYAARTDLADPMKSHMGADRYWSNTMFYFLYAG